MIKLKCTHKALSKIMEKESANSRKTIKKKTKWKKVRASEESCES